jgi:cell division protease FtsH
MASPDGSNTGGSPGPSSKRPLGSGWIWWFVAMIIILAWNLWALLPKSQPQVSLPYSVFRDQVQAGNVKSVQINGSSITGVFAHAIPWTPTPIPNYTPPVSEATALAEATPALYADFATYFPQDVGDATLLPLLEAHGVQVNVAPPPSPLIPDLLMTALPVILLVVALLWMGRQAAQAQGGAFSFGRSKARRYTGEESKVTFADVAGEDEAKTDLQEVVDFLREPQKYHSLGAHIPKGVLLVGPPGTGKTLMARAVAGQAGVPFFHLSGSEFVEMFVGVGASRVRDLFEQAKQAAPAIVFIDELDAVGRRRGTGLGNVNDEREQTLNQMLVEMDGFDDRHEVIVLAATNRPDVLDPALLRPGRFDRQVMVGLPNRQGREDILHIHTREMPLAPDVDMGVLSRTTTGFSGADLANLCNEAALIAARHSHLAVQRADFEEAVDKIVLGGERPLLIDPQARRVVAYHESGHALVAWLLPDADEVHKVTIVPHGRALGVTEQLPGEDRYNYSREYLMARLAVMLGGRSAEEIAIGQITTGAENDLVEATRLARRMVVRWGMSDLGVVALQADDEQPFLGYELSQHREYSDATAAQIDGAIRALLEERHAAARKLLRDNCDKLDKLAQGLLHEETVDGEALARILGPHASLTQEVPHGEGS